MKTLFDIGKSLYHNAVLSGLVTGRNATPFIIAGGPRSGSTWLQTLLNSHSNVVCMHELLSDRARTSLFYRHYLGRRHRLLRLRQENIQDFIDTVLLSKQPPWVHAVGFKALYIQPNTPDKRKEAWEAIGQLSDLRVVWISRNALRSVVSFVAARQTGAWIGRKTSESIRVDPVYILRRLSLESDASEMAKSRVKDCAILDVTYEKLTSDTKSELERIQKFLGVSVLPLHSPLRKQNPMRVTELVANYDELERELRGTPWHEALLEADEV